MNLTRKELRQRSRLNRVWVFSYLLALTFLGSIAFGIGGVLFLELISIPVELRMLIMLGSGGVFGAIVGRAVIAHYYKHTNKSDEE